jgi:hypothetical protein
MKVETARRWGEARGFRLMHRDFRVERRHPALHDGDELPDVFQLVFEAEDAHGDPVGLTFAQLEEVAEFFDTKAIDFISEVERGWYGTATPYVRLRVRRGQ